MNYKHLFLTPCREWNPAMILLLVTILMSSCGGGKRNDVQTGPASPSVSHISSGLRKVRLMPYWVTTAQFAGYYIGIEKGIFQKHGIDLELLPFDPFKSTKETIKKGDADFALLWLVNAIQLRSEGINLVNIAQLSSRSSLMLLAKKSSGILTLNDLNGKKAAIWSGFELQPKALFSKYNLDVEMVSIGSTNTLFLVDGAEVISANWFDEYHAILNNGYDTNELKTFFFADYGLNFPEDGLYCLAEKTRNDPGLCYDFVEATLESWNYAFSHPDETLDLVIRITRKENRPVNRSHQQWMLNCYHDLYIPGGQDSINTILLKEDYNNVSRIMLNSSLITGIIPYDSFYRPFSTMKKFSEPVVNTVGP